MMHKAAEFLRGCGAFYLATAEDDQPRVRPFGALDEFEGKLYLITSNQKPVYAQMMKSPKVEICGMNKDNQWIRIAAFAVLDERMEAREHMLESNPGLKRMYSADDGKIAVFCLKDASAVISSFTAPPDAFRF